MVRSRQSAAIKEENSATKKAKEAKQKYTPKVLANGDILKELLARSRYLLYKQETDWTINQTKRATILFEKYPILKTAYKLTLEFRAIYNSTTKSKALEAFEHWKKRLLILP